MGKVNHTFQHVYNLFHNYHQTTISRTISTLKKLSRSYFLGKPGLALLQLRLLVVDWCYKRDYIQAVL
jgi:hypothetical protein